MPVPESDPDTIPVWRRLDERITTSGQPSQEQLGALRDLGVQLVINLALHSHEQALPDEAASVAALGMRYLHIPVEFGAPAEADFARFCEAMAAATDQTVHVHCIINARVSAFMYRYRRDMLGMDETAARRAMHAVWRPGGVWAAFIGDEASVALPHRAPLDP